MPHFYERPDTPSRSEGAPSEVELAELSRALNDARADIDRCVTSPIDKYDVLHALAEAGAALYNNQHDFNDIRRLGPALFVRGLIVQSLPTVIGDPNIIDRIERQLQPSSFGAVPLSLWEYAKSKCDSQKA